MSHFSCLVVTTAPPTHDVLKAALQPFHEFECTGVDDAFVVELDRTEEHRAGYQTQTVRRFRDGDGVLHHPYEDRFYRDWTAEELATFHRGSEPRGAGGGFGGPPWSSKDWGDGRGYRSKAHVCPEGFTDVELPARELMTFAEYLTRYGDEADLVPAGQEPDKAGAHKYGFIRLDEAGDVAQVVRRTNPNKRWDWWRIGGRYDGRLRSKNDDAAYDFLAIADLDFEAMKRVRRRERADWIAELMRESSASRRQVEIALLADPVIHARWMQLPEPKPRGPEFYDWAATNCDDGETYAKVARKSFELPKLGTAKTLADWLDAAPVLTCWAVLKDGEWTEKGSMGWFGMASGEKDEAEWEAAVSAMIEALPVDAHITIVDCHI